MILCSYTQQRLIQLVTATTISILIMLGKLATIAIINMNLLALLSPRNQTLSAIFCWKPHGKVDSNKRKSKFSEIKTVDSC
jgi:hypothetical protein